MLTQHPDEVVFNIQPNPWSDGPNLFANCRMQSIAIGNRIRRALALGQQNPMGRTPPFGDLSCRSKVPDQRSLGLSALCSQLRLSLRVTSLAT